MSTPPSAGDLLPLLSRLWMGLAAFVAVTGGGLALIFRDSETPFWVIASPFVLAAVYLGIGVGLRRRYAWARFLALVVGSVSIVAFPPFGTALGVFTLYALLRSRS